MNGKLKKRLRALLPLLAACILTACARPGEGGYRNGAQVLPDASGEAHFAAYLRYRSLDDAKAGAQETVDCPDC